MMNDLVWLVYLADVVGGVGLLFELAGFVLLLAAAFMFFVGMTEDAFAHAKKPDKADNSYRDRARAFVRTFKQVCGAAAIAWVGIVLVPSKEVVYAMAAAKVAEHPRVEATANRALDALDAWLDKQTKGEE